MAKEQPKQYEEGDEVTSGFAEPWKPQKAGEKVSGYYRGFDVAESDSFAKGGSKYFISHRLETIEGEELAISGGALNPKMEGIPFDAFVFITYMGEVEFKPGRKAKDFKVVIAKGFSLLELDARRERRKSTAAALNENTPF